MLHYIVIISVYLCLALHLQPDSILLMAEAVSYVFISEKQNKTGCSKITYTSRIRHITIILSALASSFLNL